LVHLIIDVTIGGRFAVAVGDNVKLPVPLIDVFLSIAIVFCHYLLFNFVLDTILKQRFRYHQHRLDRRCLCRHRRQIQLSLQRCY
jgi:hypothetical protein